MRNKRSEEVQVNADGVGALTPERRSQMEAAERVNNLETPVRLI